MQQGETSNGISVGKKRKAADESSDLVNGTTEENSSEIDHARERKLKRTKKKHDVEIEKEEKQDCFKEKKEEKKRKKNNEENLDVGSCLGEGITFEEDKSESKKKKKKMKKYLVDTSNRTESSNSDHNNDCKTLTITNGNNKSEEHEPRKSILNGSSDSEAAVVNGDTRLSPGIDDHTSSRTVDRKVLRKAASSSSEPFAKFQKHSTPPAFVRKCLAKTPSTEPQKSKTSKLKVGDCFLFYYNTHSPEL